MKILITGVLEHIGSRLIHSIKHGQFEEVVLMDNLKDIHHFLIYQKM